MTESEKPTLETAMEIALVQRRLAAVEARVRDLDTPPASAPAGILAGRFLAGMSGVAAAALVVIAASMVWQTAHPSAAGQAVLMQAPASGDASAQAQPFRQPFHQPAGQPGMPQFPLLRPAPRG